jgi:hypothetical protein
MRLGELRKPFVLTREQQKVMLICGLQKQGKPAQVIRHLAVVGSLCHVQRSMPRL